MGVAPGTLDQAAARLGLGSCLLRVDAGRLRSRRRLLGVRAGPPRSVVRARIDPRAPLPPGRFHLPAWLCLERGFSAAGAVHTATPPSIFLRRLLRAALRPARLPAVDRLSRRGPLRRSAVDLRALAAPSAAALGARAAGNVSGPRHGQAAAAASNTGRAEEVTENQERTGGQRCRQRHELPEHGPEARSGA